MSIIKVLSAVNTTISILLLLVFLLNNFQIYEQEIRNSEMFQQLREEVDSTRTALQNEQNEQYNLLLDEINNQKSSYLMYASLANKKDQNNENKRIKKQIEELEAKANDFSDVIKTAMQGVVKITIRIKGEYKDFPLEEVKEEIKDALSKKGYSDYEDSESEITIIGTGTIIDNSGLIVTNKHVANVYEEICIDSYFSEFFTCTEENAEIEVQTSKGENFSGELESVSEEYDLAFVKTEIKNKALKLTSQSYLGEEVVALGNPLDVGFTATKGIISAINRDLNDGFGDFWIQTDTPINQGNSGGPLINKKGEITGITTQKLSFFSEGMGFAIPSRIVKEELLK